MCPSTTMASSPPQRSSPLNAVKCSASKDQAACNDLPSEGQAQDTHVLCAI
ncbi:MAG: hypothetical protein RLZZ413_1509, partial [Pseudomonadota bacterium]